MTTRVYSIPDFRRLWLVGLVSFVVRWLEILAVGVFAYEATGSPFVVAVLTMLRMLPMGLFGAFMGAAADRLERRTALIAAVLMLMGSSLGVAVLATLDMLEVWHLGVAAFVNGMGWAADNPVRRMMIGDIVGPERMGAAMSIDVGANNASRMLGPMMGGFLVSQAGIGGVFWLGSALYVVALVAAILVTHRSRSGESVPQPFLAGLRDGLTYLRTDRALIGIFLVTIIFNVFAWPFTSMIPVLGKDQLLLAPEGVGLLASLDGVGAFVGALAIGAFARVEWHGRIYLSGVSLYICMLVTFAAVAFLPVAAAALLLVGFGGAGFNVMQATLVYRYSPAAMRARLLGVLSVCIGCAPLGFLYLGLLADLFGAQTATIAIGLHGAVALLLARPFWRLLL